MCGAEEGAERVKPVLVGVDGSIASRAAVSWAVERARADGREVELRFVVDDEWGVVGAPARDELRADAEALVQRELAFARGPAGAVPVRAGFSVGPPILTLADAARDADVVVVGTHKVGVFHGMALGSRSLQLAAISPVPVAIVPAPSGESRSGIVMGVGGGIDEDVVVRAAVAESNRSGEPLVLVRSFTDRVALGEQALDHATRLAETLAPSAGVSRRRSSTSAGEALAVMSGQAVLTVVGRPTAPGQHGYRPLGRAVSDLLMNLRGPALVVPFPHTDERRERSTFSAHHDERRPHAIPGPV